MIFEFSVASKKFSTSGILLAEPAASTLVQSLILDEAMRGSIPTPKTGQK